jgi:hypothetical protein
MTPITQERQHVLVKNPGVVSQVHLSKEARVMSRESVFSEIFLKSSELKPLCHHNSRTQLVFLQQIPQQIARAFGKQLYCGCARRPPPFPSSSAWHLQHGLLTSSNPQSAANPTHHQRLTSGNEAAFGTFKFLAKIQARSIVREIPTYHKMLKILRSVECQVQKSIEMA